MEPLCLTEDRDPNQIINWLERFEANLDIYLFDISEKLPTDAAQKTAKVEALSRNILIASVGPHTHKLLKSYCQPKTLAEHKYKELKICCSMLAHRRIAINHRL